MMPVALSDTIAVGEVPTAEEIAILATAGFRSMLNTQPEGEVARHLTSADCFRACEQAGLAYRHIPIETRRPPERDIDAFAKALAEMPKPIYACCYSGARTAAVWALAAAAIHDADMIIGTSAAAGHDLQFMRDDLVARYRAHTAQPPAQTQAQPPATPAAEATPTPITPVPIAVPVLIASPVVPRAASAGGFAVAG